MTQIDWGTALEDGIDDGPAVRSPAEAVAAGRRVLRRRRLTQGVLGGTVLALVATVGLEVGVLADRDPTVTAATSPPAADHRPVPAGTDLPVHHGQGGCGIPVCFDGDGRLVRESVDVRVNGVYTDVVSADGSGYWDETAAVSATLGGETTWWLLRWVPDQGSGGGGPARHDMDFDQWVSRLHDEPWLYTGGRHR